ncbi:hypothetical protein HYH03_008645 [Edaphochlamys debaryana]|uniref:RRM domain-containing protein n=1 Tax=Edaphochlamys debaryana TaxID=47281 RepID=A0A835Y0U1_9CHLO|nr:hypothetical protein HYH03_008645 [Edaphochlamys debaryana]|eukprot:KAG2493229.1 hypothetical protein HYH03_008645 [Edaphochlamys debaryana]
MRGNLSEQEEAQQRHGNEASGSAENPSGTVEPSAPPPPPPEHPSHPLSEQQDPQHTPHAPPPAPADAPDPEPGAAESLLPEPFSALQQSFLSATSGPPGSGPGHGGGGNNPQSGLGPQGHGEGPGGPGASGLGSLSGDVLLGTPPQGGGGGMGGGGGGVTADFLALQQHAAAAHFASMAAAAQLQGLLNPGLASVPEDEPSLGADAAATAHLLFGPGSAGSLAALLSQATPSTPPQPLLGPGPGQPGSSSSPSPSPTPGGGPGGSGSATSTPGGNPGPGGGSAAHAAAAQAAQQQLWDELRQRDAQILVLQKKLGHFRSWLASVHAKVQAANPSAINNYKRLYVGNLPPNTTEDELKAFLHGLMVRTGANAAPGNSILSCKLKAAPGAAGGPMGGPPPPPPPGLPPGHPPDKHYAFIELRSVEEASNAMAFDGVAFKNAYLKVRRPSNYDAATAMMLGPTTPDPTIDLSALEICRTVVENSPHKLFVGGLPCEWSEDMVKELLVPYGTLKSFNLVMDKSTGKSKGYAFCEFVEESSADLLIKNLHMRRVGSKALTVKRAMEGGRNAPGVGPGGGLGSGQGSSGGGAPPGGSAGPLSIAQAQQAQAQQQQAQAQALASHMSGHAHMHQHHQGGVAGSPPAIPLTPVGVAAAAARMGASPGGPGGSPGGGPGGSGGGSSSAAVAAAAMAAAAALDSSSPTALQDAITALLQQHNAATASRNLLSAAAAAAAAVSAAGGAPGTPPPPPPPPPGSAAGLAAALQQFQRSAELSSAGGSGSSGDPSLQSVGSRGPMGFGQLGVGPPMQSMQSMQQSMQHHQQHHQQHSDAAAAAAAAQEAVAAQQQAAAHQLAAAAAAAAQQGGVGAFDLSSLTGHQNLGFW